MVEENISQELTLKNIDETRNYFLEEMEHNKVMSMKRKRFKQLSIILNNFLL